MSRRQRAQYVEAAAVNPASPTVPRPCPSCGASVYMVWIGRTLRDVTLDAPVDLFTDRYRVHQCSKVAP